jgi:4,4'-diaponeurosporenoate glycosyltransferase
MEHVALVVGALLALQQGVFWLVGFFLLWKIPRCRPAPGHPGPARLSLIIPARNEERTLPVLLASLASQEPAADEIVVVDDGSEDATAVVAARGGARVVAAGPKPEDWIGKSWACWKGAQAAAGDLLVFLDADTALGPGGLATLAGTHGDDGGLVGVQPYHAIRRPYEALAAVFNIVVMAGMNCFSPLGRRLAPAGSFGPCMVCSRAEYFAAGGHAAVKDAIVEDLALGRLFQAAGLPVSCYGGRGTISFRMYPDGLRSLVEGFTKNMAIGASEMRRGFRALIVLWLIGATACVISAGASLLPPLAIFRPMEGIFYALYAAQMYWMLRRIGSFGPLTALLFPLPLAFFHVVFFRSTRMVRGRNIVTWKGRSIATHGKGAHHGT